MRLALVTPRFWPLADDAATHLLRLAEQFRAAGHEVTVVSAAWHSSWPRAVAVREIPLVRLKGTPRGGFSALRYMFGLTRWLKQHRGQLDAVLVATLRYEAYAALATLARSGPRVVLQADLAGPAGDIAWQRTASFGGRIARRCQQAEQIIAASPLVAEELAAAGYDRERLTVIPYGVPLPPAPSACTHHRAREALAGVNQDLATLAEAPVALAIGRLEPQSGFAHLVKAWKSVAARFPAARLWIIGDGPERDRLYQLTGDLDLRQRAFLPGIFSDHHELFEAADLYIQPATTEGPVLPLVEAMANGLACIASHLPSHRQWIEPGRTGLLVPPADSPAIARALIELLEHPARRIELGSSARQQIRQSHSLESCALQYLSILAR
ncbi:MAG: glycosyltransferase family 4 protein [Planctomycetaceae bacterium]|nr:glycosyltransferase family 4 protein [Planctomycetaceae bacterium]